MKNSKMAQALSLLARSNDEKNNIDRLADGEDEEIDAEKKPNRAKSGFFGTAEIFTVNFALGINYYKGLFGKPNQTSAVFQMEHNKAPGPDRFPVEFYQVFWEVIKNDLMALLMLYIFPRMN
ncbi:hypothetical protein ACJX0J_040581, partial [Zea mays]